MVSVNNITTQSQSLLLTTVSGSPSTSSLSPLSSPSTSKKMSQRESRHVHVCGLSESVTDDRINTFFSTFGRVQKVEKVSDGFIVSFMDVRSAQKAHAADHRLDSGQTFRIAFHDHSKSNSMTTGGTVPSGSSCTNSPRAVSSTETPAASSFRSSSPQRSKDHRTPQPPRFSSSVSTSSVKRTSSRPENHHRRSETGFGKCSPVESSGGGTNGCSGSGTTGGGGGSTHQGLQGVYVDRLPPRGELTLKEAIRETMKKHGRVVDVHFEGVGEERRALVVFQRVLDMDKLLAESPVPLLNARVRIRLASHVAVTEAYNQYLMQNSATASGLSLPSESSMNLSSTSQQDLPAKYAHHNGRDKNEVNVFNMKASRTLYVGGLESRISDDTLRRRFKQFGSILDVDVKNYESPSPFAFIQFADIDSAVRAINFHATQPCANKKGKKFQPNFGRSMTTSKLWVGGIPTSASEEYVAQKLRALSDGVTDVIFDAKVHQALVICSTTEQAQQALQKIRNGIPKQFVFKDGSGCEVKVPADYCSDRLHDFFVDRKHQSSSSSSSILSAPSSSLPLSYLSVAGVSHQSLDQGGALSPVLAPPPDPPSQLHGDMPSYVSRDHYRTDSRRSDSRGSRRREKSRERRGASPQQRHRSGGNGGRRPTHQRRQRSPRRMSGSSSDSDSSRGSSRSSSSDSRDSLRYRSRDKEKEREREKQKNGGAKKEKELTKTTRIATPPPQPPTILGVGGGGGKKRREEEERVQISSEADDKKDVPLIDPKHTVVPNDRDVKEQQVLEEPPPPPPLPPPPLDPVPSTSSHAVSMKDPMKVEVKEEPQPTITTIPSSHRTPPSQKNDVIIHPPPPTPTQKPQTGSVNSLSSNTQQPAPPIVKRPSTESYLFSSQPHHVVNPDRLPRWPGAEVGEVMRRHITVPTELNTNVKDPRLNHESTRPPGRTDLKVPFFATIFWTHKGTVPLDIRKHSSSSGCGGMVERKGSKPGAPRTPVRSAQHSRHGSISGASEHESLSRRPSGAYTPPGGLEWEGITVHQSALDRTRSSSGSEEDEDEGQCSPIEPPKPSSLDFIVNSNDDEKHAAEADLLQQMDELTKRFETVEDTFKATKEESVMRSAQVVNQKPVVPEKQTPIDIESELERLMDLNKQSTVAKLNIKVDPEKMKSVSSRSFDPMTSILMGAVHRPTEPSTSSGFSKPPLSISIPPPSNTSGVHSAVSTPGSAPIQSPRLSRKPSAPTPAHISASSIRVPTTSSSAILPPPTPTPSTGVSPPHPSTPSSSSLPFPPNFSVPPPLFTHSASLSPLSVAREPILSAPPQPPPMPQPSSTSLRRDSTSSLPPAPSTPRTLSPPPPPASRSGVTVPSMVSTPKSHRSDHGEAANSGAYKNKTPAPINRDSKSARHESFSGTARTPTTPFPPPTSVQRSMSMTDPKAKPNTPIVSRDATNEMLDKLFKNQTGISADIKKLPRIEKKVPPPGSTSEQQASTSRDPKPPREKERSGEHREKEKKHHKEGREHREHKEHKEHREKLRRKEDGTYETKEERAKRKEHERARKEKEDRREKDERKARKKAEKEKARQLQADAERKAREKKSKSKKKKKRNSGSEDSSADSAESDDEYTKSVKLARLLEAALPIGGSMYDRVKRRSSGLNKDDAEKKKTLEMLREKANKKKKKRVAHLSSSEEEDRDEDDEEEMEDEEKKDTDQSSSDEAEEQHKHRKTSKSDKKKMSKQSRHDLSSSGPESGDSEGDEERAEKQSAKRKKKKKEKKQSNFDLDDVFNADSSNDESTQPGPSSLFNEREKSERRERERREKETTKKEKKMKKHRMQESSDGSDREGQQKKKMKMENLFGSVEHKKEKKEKKREKKEKEREERKRMIERVEELHAKRRKKNSEQGTTDDSVTPKRPTTPPHLTSTTTPTLTTTPTSSTTPRGKREETSRGRETSQQPPAMVQQIQVDEVKREKSCDPVVHKPSSEALLSPRLNGPETTTVFGTVTGTVPVPKTSPMCSPVIKEKEPVVVPKVERASPARRSLTPPRAIPATSNTSTTPAIAKTDERPKLMTKAAMKVFVPSQNVATSMVPAVPAPSSAQPTSVEPTVPSSVKPTVTPTVPPATQSTTTAVTTSSAAVKTSEAAVIDRHLSSDSEDDDFGPLTTAVAQNPVPNVVGVQNDAVGWSSEDAGSSSDSDVERQLLNRMNATGPELVDATRQFEQEPVTVPEPIVTATPTVTKREPEITFSMTPERIPEVVPDLCVSTSLRPLPSAHSPLVRDEEIESAVTGIVTQEHDEETSNAVDSIAIFDDEDEPEPEYPSQDFINQVELPLECDRVAEEEAQRAADALEMMDTDRHSSSGDEADVERVHAQRREQEVSHLSSQQPHFDTSSVSAGVVTASADVSMESPIRKPPSPIPEHQLNHGAMIVAPPIHTPKEEELVQAPAAVVPVTTPTVAFSSPTIVSPTTSTTSTLPTTPSRTTPVLTPTVDKPMFPTTYPPPAPSTPITSPLPLKGSSMPTNPFAALAVSSSGGLAVPTIQSSVPAVSPGVQSASSSQFGMASHQQFGLPTPSTVTSSVAAPMTLSSPRFTQPPRIDVDQPAQSTTVPQQPLQYASPRAKPMMASPSVPSATTPTTSHIQAVYNPYASLGTEQPTPSTTTAAPMFSMPTSASVIQQQQQQHLKPLASPQQRSSSVASTSSQPQQMPSAVQLPPVTQMGGLTQGIPLQQQQQLLFYQQQQQQQMQRKQQPATPSPAPSASPVVSAAVAQHQQLQQQQQHQIQHMQQAMELWKQMQQRPEMFAQRPDLILQLQLYMQNPLYLHQIQQQALAASAAAMQRQTASPASSSSRLHSPHPSSTPTMTQQQQQQQLLKKQQQEAYFAQAKAQQQREQQLQAQQLKQREQQQREQQQREQQQREQQQREQQQQQRERELQREREQQIANQRLLAVFQQQQQYQQQQQLAAAMVAVTSQAQASQHQLAAAHQASQLAAAQQAHQQMLQQVQAHQQQQQQQQQQQVVPVPATASVVEKKAPLPQQPRAAEQAPVADAAPAVVAQAAQQPQPAAQPALAAPVAPPAPAAAPAAATTSGAEGVENHPPLQEATNQDRSKNERFPVIWQGQLAMKNQEATVQFHMVAGVGDLVLKSLGNTKEGPTQHVKRVVRINQRMRLEPSQLQTVMGKLNGQSPFACMICLPCGENREVFQCNAQTFKTAFVDYFTQKQAAGIANIPERELTQSCLVHIFPPGPFPAQYLEYFSPELFQNIKQKDASYLFIVLTPEERVAA